ncbi:DUF2630 family protein [Actinospica sp. MGRD01-02]|uniref:DUF2630 family protein n=1 Tax=Actinospica acidithermotolerans TaxID=2828514 RepID=A0A941IJS3_9ACTN|nr:DUF2630 family protein [Actinospica acidithermotolerans]MBR7831075.1 DUF2630 family protein [Actinospica acidithermotolerans]
MADANAEIHRRINDLIDEEHRLRGDGAPGDEPEVPDADRRRRLAELEMQLDQAWDLLRQRQARREWAQDPGRARERPTRVVENYES